MSRWRVGYLLLVAAVVAGCGAGDVRLFPDAGARGDAPTSGADAARFDAAAPPQDGGGDAAVQPQDGGVDAAAPPQDGPWTTAANMATPRGWQTATLLPSGVVLVAGGNVPYPPGVTATAELYDPATNTWTAAVSVGAGLRRAHTATLLPSGNVLAVGGDARWRYGDDDSCSGVPDWASALLYDPASDAWAGMATMASPRERHTATLLQSGKLLVAGGDWYDCNAPYAGIWHYLAAAELYDPGSNSLDRRACADHGAHRAHGYAAAVGSSAGGRRWDRKQHHLGSPCLLRTLRPGEQRLDRGELPGRGARRAHGDTAAVGQGARGRRQQQPRPLRQRPGSVVASAELYDPGLSTWTAAGAPATPRTEHTATLLPSGLVLVAGGGSGDTSAELYDPGSNTWTIAASMAAGRHGHTATLLPSGKVLVAGGWGGIHGDEMLASAELYDPAVDDTPRTTAAGRRFAGKGAGI